MPLLAFWNKICSWFPTCKYGVTALARLRLLQLEQICCTDFSENLPQARTEYKWNNLFRIWPNNTKQPMEKIYSVSTECWHSRQASCKKKKKKKKHHILLRLGKASQGVCFARFPLMERIADWQFITVHDFSHPHSERTGDRKLLRSAALGS